MPSQPEPIKKDKGIDLHFDKALHLPQRKFEYFNVFFAQIWHLFALYTLGLLQGLNLISVLEKPK